MVTKPSPSVALDRQRKRERLGALARQLDVLDGVAPLPAPVVDGLVDIHGLSVLHSLVSRLECYMKQCSGAR